MQTDRPAALRKASELTGFTIHDAGNFTNEQVQQFLIGLTQDTSRSNARLVRSLRERKSAVDYGASQIEHIVIGHGIGDGDNWRLVGSGEKVKDYINKVVPKGKTAWCVVCSDSDPKRVGIVQGVAIVSKGNQVAQTEKNLSPQILARLDFLEQFKPSSEVPSPSFSPNGVAMDDFVYVLMGRKPAGYLNVPRLEEQSGMKLAELKAVMERQGLVIAEVPNSPENIFFGVEANVKEALKLWTEVPSGSRKNNPDYHQRLGRIFGYPEEAIDAFLGKNTEPLSSPPRTPFKSPTDFNQPSLVEARVKLATEKADEVLKNDLAARYYDHPLSKDLPENPYVKSPDYSAYNNLGLPKGAKGSNRDTIQQGWKDNQEWKLRLNVTPENAKAVSDYLQNKQYTYKFLSGGELESGKIFTIYIGSYTKSVQEAQKLSSDLKQYLCKPFIDEDIEFAAGVTGRFREQSQIITKEEERKALQDPIFKRLLKDRGFHEYGYFGFSSLKKDIRNIVHKNKHKRENLPPDEYLQWKKEHHLNTARNAFIELYKKYGDYFYPLSMGN